MAQSSRRHRRCEARRADRMATSDDADLESGRMPFVEHLRELRDRLRNASIAFAIAFAGCWFFAEKIYTWARLPLDHAWAVHAAKLGPTPIMFFPSPVTPFWVYISVALWAGVFVASPFIFHQIWQFI